MKHAIEDHSLFEELVEEYFQEDGYGEDMEDFARNIDVTYCLGSIIEEADYEEVRNPPNSEGKNDDIADLDFEAQLFEVIDQVCNHEKLECVNNAEVKKQVGVVFSVAFGSDSKVAQEVEADSNPTRAEPIKSSRDKQPKAETMSAHMVSSSIHVSQMDPKSLTENSSSPPPPMELKPLPNYLKYAHLNSEQQLPVIISNNLHQEQEDKLLEVLRQHKKAIGWKLSDLLGINPSICMHRILMEQQQRRLNSTILNVVKKEVTKLLAAGIIYPISDSQWVSPVQVVPKKSGMTVTKNRHDELVPMRIQNSWQVCIDYRRLNQATRKDHFPFPFIDQVLEKLLGKSHYYFLDGFSGCMQIHIAPEDQHKTTFTYPFSTFAYTCMPFGLCNAPSTFQRCMITIFSNLLQDCMEVFMDDFIVYADAFEACLSNLSKVLKRCIDKPRA
ncbi:hypothetical protein CR513_20305, partial [Mucuna pruriens]